MPIEKAIILEKPTKINNLPQSEFEQAAAAAAAAAAHLLRLTARANYSKHMQASTNPFN